MIARCSTASTRDAVEVAAGQFEVPRHVAERAEQRLQAVRVPRPGTRCRTTRERGRAVGRRVARARSTASGSGARPRRGRECRPSSASTRARSARRAAPRTASHSSTFRTWHTSRTSRAVTRRTTAPRFGNRSTTPIPRSSISASRIGVWLTPKAVRERFGDQPLAGAQPAVEDVGQDGADDRGPAQAVVER